MKIKYCPHCGAVPDFALSANPKNFCSIECTCGCKTDGHKICKVSNTLEENKRLNVEVWNRRYKRERGRPERVSKEEILKLRHDGMGYAKIAVHVGCSKTYVIKVCKKIEEGN